MSILIADSGATKTSWVLLSDGRRHGIRTSGLNPHPLPDREIEQILSLQLLPVLENSKINSVFFYGAGCRTKEQVNRIHVQLKKVIPKAEINIATDIEGAGLALFHREPGILIISGTGSSAGFMSEGKLVDIMSTTVFPEGDFGSGSHIGLLILQDYLSGKTPGSIKEILDKMSTLNAQESLSKQTAASVLKNVAITNELLKHPELEYLIKKATGSIELLLKRLVHHFGKALTQNQVKMIGTTALYFEPVFREVFSNAGIKISEIEQSPIEGLINYHISNS